MAWAPDYVTLAEMKNHLRLTDSVDDAEIALDITAASRAVDRATNRQFGLVAAPEVRTYTAWWDKVRRKYVVDIDDLMTTVGLVVTVNGVIITDYSLKPSNAAAKGKPWTQIVLSTGGTCTEDGVSMLGRWGWTAFPDTVKRATKLQGSRFFKRRDAPFGVAGSPDIGSELRLLAKVDPDVAVMLGDYNRWWGAA